MPSAPHLPTEFVHEFTDRRTGLLATPGPGGKAAALAFGADSRLLAIAGDQPTVDLWDSRQATQVAALAGHKTSTLTRTVWSLAFSPDGQLLASGGHDRTVRLWNATNGESVNVIAGFSGPVRHLAFHPSGRALAVGDEDAVRLFDLGSGAVTPVPLADGGINDIALSPDGSLLAVALGGRSRKGSRFVALVDPASGQTVRKFADDGLPARSVSFSPDGRLLAVVPRGGDNVWLCDTVSWEIVKRLKAFTVNKVAFSSQGALGAAVGDNACVWDPASAAKPATAKVPYRKYSEVETLAFSPDGNLLATCRSGSSVRIYR
jgi:WD40 repeat protein